MDRSLRILFIDDDASRRAMLMSALQQTLPDSEVELVLKEPELSQALQATVPDLLIMAPQMPWMAGDVLVRTLKKQWPATPLLIVATHGTAAEALQLCEAGADDYCAAVTAESFNLAVQLALIRATRQRQGTSSQPLPLQQARPLEADASFARNLGHDLNNLLYAIRGYADLLLTDIPRESPAWRNVQAILTASERANGLVQHMLACTPRQEMLPPPAVGTSAYPQPSFSTPLEEPQIVVEPVRILLVEDDTATRSMLKQMLERSGYQISEARDGAEGLRVYRRMPPDLVITDILMPEKEGLAFIRELQQERPRPKIIAISGGGHTGMLDFLHVAERLGAQRALHKPLRQHELLEAIESVLAMNE